MKTIETFLSVPGYEGYYEISNLGNIKSLRSGKLMKQSSNRDGYKLVSLTLGGKSKCYSVHRLVALTFIPNPLNLPEINHKDENPSNNCVDNLEWCDRKYNLNYGGYRERMSKTQILNNKARKPIASFDKTTGALVKKYNSIVEAERELGLSRGAIGKALSGEIKTSAGYTWKYIRKDKHLTLQDLEPKKNIDLTPSKETSFFMERSKWLSEKATIDDDKAISVVNF